MDVKGVIDCSKLVKPFTRSDIAKYLMTVETNQDQLTAIENKELVFYSKEYWYEMKSKAVTTPQLHFFKTKNLGDNRFQFFQYSDSVFNVVLNPILGGEIAYKYDEMQYHRWGGASVYFNLGKHWGGQMDFRDNWEKGDRIDKYNVFNTKTGIQKIGGENNEIEYSEVKGAVTYESKYINISAGKEWFNWGSGYRSQLILSQKAPSFPYIRMDLKPVSWLRFYYIHAWLNSRVPDSSEFYKTQIYSDTNKVYRIVDRPKFYAAHILEIIIKKRIRFSIGESVVYSDDGPKLEYFVPFLIFRMVDHYNEGEGGFGRGSNSQIFLDLNVGLIKKVNFYGTFFIDEFSFSNFIRGDNSRNQFGYTVGSSVYDLIIPNLLFRFEYTRILPWVYSNFVQTQTYTNCNYLMGHYIGQNADQIYSQVSYFPLRGLSVSLWGEYIRRGGFKDVYYQYRDPGENFLYGPVRKEMNIGLSTSYEVINDLFLRINYELSDISDEDKNRSRDYELGLNHSFGFSVFYGL